MAYEINPTRVFRDKLLYQIANFREYRSDDVAQIFYDGLLYKIGMISKSPYIGQESKIKEARSIRIPFDFRLYYRVTENSIDLLNLISTKANPENNPFE